MAHHIVYIPGLGDHHTYGQDLVINLWRLYGFTPHYLPLGWRQKQGFAVKRKRITDYVAALAQSGDHVSLIGVSAGASAALNAYVADRTPAGVVCICGKINHPETVRPAIYRANPDFEESMAVVQDSLRQLTHDDKRRLLSIHGLKDASVPPADTMIPGVRSKTVIGWSHKQGIAAGIVVGAPAIARFLHTASARA